MGVLPLAAYTAYADFSTMTGDAASPTVEGICLGINALPAAVRETLVTFLWDDTPPALTNHIPDAGVSAPPTVIPIGLEIDAGTRAESVSFLALTPAEPSHADLSRPAPHSAPTAVGRVGEDVHTSACTGSETGFA